MEWYEDQAQFCIRNPLPMSIRGFAGPHGVALVHVFDEGKTSAGWGAKTFMKHYERNNFASAPRISLAHNGKPFAIVMRSVSLVALDIDRHTDDGGADGFIAAAKLKLPPTLAQTSKSGQGRHLFYAVYDMWSTTEGFAAFPDVIGLRPGIDVRGTGCIYRYSSQQWTDLPIALLPQNVLSLLETRRDMRIRVHTPGAAAVNIDDWDEVDMVVAHDALKQELGRAIPVGKRNATLFAIGAQMRDAGYPDWEQALLQRADEVQLSPAEADKLVANITKYAN